LVIASIIARQIEALRRFERDGVIRTVWIDYPPALKSKYDPLVGAIAGSLRGP
jgi:hypothetical protein